MTARQKTELALSKSREGLQAAALDDSVETAKLEELTTAHAGLEKRYQAAVLSEVDTPDIETSNESTPEGRELRGLIERSDICDVALATIEYRETDGATRELQQHFGLAPNMVPLELFRDIETRVVTAPGANCRRRQRQQEGIFASGLF